MSSCECVHTRVMDANEHVRKNKFRIAHNNEIGRHLVSAVDILPGETIISEPAIVRGPCIDSKQLNSVYYDQTHENETVLVCSVCFCGYKSVVGVSCSLCNCNIFCSTQCSTSSNHNESECKVLEVLKTELVTVTLKQLYSLISTLRCLRLRNSSQWKQILQLQSKVENFERRKELEWIDNLFSKLSWELVLQSKVQMESGDGDLSLRDAARHCLGVMRVNAFSFLQNSLGFEGLYFLTSLLTHSCIMNTDRQFDQMGNMVVRAATLIKQGDVITTSYLPLLNNTEQRREQMNSSWLFECKCRRCEDKDELGTFMSSSSLPLQENSELNSTSILKEIVESMPQSLDDIEALEAWLEEFDTGKYLHTNYSLFSQLKAYLCLYYGRQSGGIQELPDRQLLKKYQFCHQLLDLYDIIYPGVFQCKGELLFEFWLTLREMRDRKLLEVSTEYEESVAQKALDILKHATPHSSFGKMHEILREEFPMLG